MIALLIISFLLYKEDALVKRGSILVKYIFIENKLIQRKDLFQIIGLRKVHFCG